jgi:ATP-binding cassette subfamily F protein 3
MLTVSGLSKSYGKQVLFEDVSFQVAPGERVGLVGRNGHGKTTLFRILLGEESADGGTIAVPSGYRIGHLAQRLEFPRPTVLEEAASALLRREDGTDETYKAKAVLAGLGFDEADLGRAPAGLSGGFQVRLNLARVLVSTPDLLLLDEPTNYLDIVSIRWLRRFLCAWKGALILVTHDRDFMDSVTTHTMAIHRCRVRKLAGGTEKLYAQILQEETIHEQTRMNDERRRKEAEAFINRFRAQAAKAKAVQSRIKLLARHERLEKLAEIRDLDFRFAEAPFAGKWMLEARGLSFRYDPARPLIEGFSLSVARGDRVAVVGPNGKGKTTLLRLLAGELSPASGAVKTSANVKIGYFGQTNVDRLQPAFSIEEEVRQGNPSLTRTQVRNLCGAMMFGGDAAEKRVSVLSGGERSRVLLAKILASPVNLLLLDEPTNHLDQESVDAFLEALDAFEGAVVIVTHVERVLSALATRLVVFDGGKTEVFEGGYADFLERVGWSAESAEGAIARTERGSRENRRDRRRRRAELVERRSRELGALRCAIGKVEEEIMSLEERVAADEAAIVEASVRNDGPAIREASSSASAARRRIEELYEDLSALGKELQEKEREFGPPAPEET